jgi:hypothetical protein
MNKDILRYIGKSVVKKHNVKILGITEQPNVYSILISYDKEQAMFNIPKDDIKRHCEVIKLIIQDQVDFKE